MPDHRRHTVVLVDDEPDARALLEARLRDYPDFRLLASCSSGPQAVTAVRQHRPDLLLLDVTMPGMSGFEVLEQVADSSIRCVVFVTAYDRFAVKAFEHAAVDYLLKPFTKKRFQAMLERVRDRLSSPSRVNSRVLFRLWEHLKTESPSPTQSSPYLERLVIRDGAGQRTLDITAVDMIVAEDHYCRIHTDSRVHSHYESLQELEGRLDPRQFCRVHRSTIIRLDSVTRVLTGRFGTLTLILRNGAKARVSRQRRLEFETIMLARGNMLSTSDGYEREQG